MPMNHIELESRLRQRIKIRRLSLGIATAVFLAVFLIFFIAYYLSGEVTVTGWGPFEYRSVEYNDSYLWGVLLGLVVFINSIILFIIDLVSSKFKTVEISGEYITFYRGLIHVSLYINGERADSLSFFNYYLEASLKNGIKVNVAVGKWSAHMSFTNGYPPIDL